MTSVVRMGFLEQKPGTVWDVLADFAAISRWAPNVDHSYLLTRQTAGVGTARRIQTGRTTLVETVVEWQPPASDTAGVLAYTIAGLPPVVRSVTNRWRLDRRGGGTAISLTSEISTGPRPPQRAIARIAGRRLGAASTQMIAGLAAHLNASKQETTR